MPAIWDPETGWQDQDWRDTPPDEKPAEWREIPPQERPRGPGLVIVPRTPEKPPVHPGVPLGYGPVKPPHIPGIGWGPEIGEA